MKFERFKEALRTLGVTGSFSLRDLRKRYREMAKTARNTELYRLNDAYKVILEFIERYPFRFSEDEFYKAFPEERVKKRFGDSLWSEEKK